MQSIVSRSERYKRVMESLRIRNEEGIIQPMYFNDAQRILWTYIAPVLDANQRLRLIVLKARQTGISTFFQSLLFVRTIESPGTQSLVMAQDLDTSQALFGIAKRFLEYLPLPSLAPPKVKEIVFPFPSAPSTFRVISAGVSAKGRGTTQTCIHASEVAFWQHAEVLTGIVQVMPDVPNTIFILESTANGKVGDGAMFYEEWTRAISGDSELQPIFIPWFAMPKYKGSAIGKEPIPESEWDAEEKALVKTFDITGDELAWRRFAIKTKCQGSTDWFHQEYPSTPDEAFISTGLPAFDRLALMQQRPNICPPSARGTLRVLADKSIVFDDDPTGVVRIWKHPEPDGQYVIGADTAEGIVGGDFSCAEVINMKTLEQVACIHGAIPPRDFAYMLNALGRWYNRAVLAVEVNNHGHACMDHLVRTFMYPNLHQWRGRSDRIKMTNARYYGWETNSWSRPLLIEAGRRAINECLVTIHEEKLMDELHDFSRHDNGKYAASAGKDDRVIAFLIALRSREENYFPVKERLEVSESEIEQPSLPSGIRIMEAGEDTKIATLRRTRKLLSRRAKDVVDSFMKY